jgi:alkylation response protein AidB-like acyl-CoA dehydrogenase
VENVLKHSRVIVIWNAVGGCIGVYKRAIKYAMIKKSFGRLIGGFQLVQEKLVKMMANIQAIILSAWKNTEMYEKDNETSTAKIGMFKAWVTERGRLICSLGR